LVWDWWAAQGNNVVELKSSAEYHQLADHYMLGKIVPSREEVLQMKKEIVQYRESGAMAEREIPETPQPKSSTIPRRDLYEIPMSP
jgi:hypothetical protein